MTTEIEAWIGIQIPDDIKILKKLKFSVDSGIRTVELHKEVIQRLSSLIMTTRRKISTKKYNNSNKDKFVDSFKGRKKHYKCEIYIKGEEYKKRAFVVAIDKHATPKEVQKIMNSVAMQYISWGFIKDGKTSKNIPEITHNIFYTKTS